MFRRSSIGGKQCDSGGINRFIEKRGIRRTALMWAACHGDTETVRDLIARGASVDVVTPKGVTAVMFAAHNGHTETVEVLIQSGADLNQSDKKGKTALMFAEGAFRTQTAALITQYMQMQQQHNVSDADRKMSCSGSSSNVDRFIEKRGIQRTALMWAACHGDTETVRDLIAHGASVDVVTPKGVTAVMFAAHNGHTETVEVLIQSGADLNQSDKKGKTALMFAEGAFRTQTAALITQYMQMQQKNASGSSSKDLGKEVQSGQDVTSDIGNLAKATLFGAAKIGQTDVITELITCQKEYINATDGDGKTVLMVAAAEGHVDTIQELIHMPNINIDAVDHDGKSALDYALQENNTEVVELIEKLRNLHTAPNIEDEDGDFTTECQLCFCNKPNIAFIPCGHGTCDACFRDLKHSEDKPKCHVCRENIKETLKLYL